MDCSTPGFPVHHQLLEFTQTHIHWVSDAIQPSHLLSPPSPPALNLSQHQGLFQRVSSKEQGSFNFIAAVTIYSDLKTQENKACHCFHCFPTYLPWSDGIFVFWMLSFKPAFSLSSFTFIKKLFSSSSVSAIRVVSSAYLRLLIFLQLVLPPAQHFSRCTLHISYISRVTIYSLDILFFLFGTSLLFHVQF